MSGGVDSSVAAHLLLHDGFSVYGVFITIKNPSHIPCTSTADKQDAMRACAALKIPFLEYDATAEYQKKVIHPFIESYRRGSTPNPDVLCNQHIKFDVLYDFLSKKGFNFIATGHYACVASTEGVRRLYRSVDEEKDQTYFIYTISQGALDRTLFPVGKYTKSQVRSMATDAGLPAAQKKDSTGLCFLGDISMRDFLSAYIKPEKGEVKLISDECVIGAHDGAWFYTIGQRHGFTITATDRGPYVVVKKDIQENTLFVQKGDKIEGVKEFFLTDTLFRCVPEQDKPLYARYRHRGDLCPISLSNEKKDRCKIIFTDPQVIAPGQSIVLYSSDGECLGGGVYQAEN